MQIMLGSDFSIEQMKVRLQKSQSRRDLSRKVIEYLDKLQTGDDKYLSDIARSHSPVRKESELDNFIEKLTFPE